MKAIIVLFILIFCNCIVNAQINGNAIEAQKVNLKDTNNSIIGAMVIIPGLARDVFLKNYTLIKDSNGLYITDYKFVQLNNVEVKRVIIIFQLNEKFKDVYYKVDGDSTVFKTNISNDKFSTSIVIQSLPINALITVRFTSKKILTPTITGIGGQLDFRRN